MEEAVYKFDVYCGRMGSLEGVFVAPKEHVKQLMGHEVHFGEVLGKHSSISVDIGPENLTMISDDANVVEVVKKHNLSSGFDPFNYLDEDSYDCEKGFLDEGE